MEGKKGNVTGKDKEGVEMKVIAEEEKDTGRDIGYRNKRECCSCKNG